MKAVTTWANNQAEEDLMNDDHFYLWDFMIDQFTPNSLGQKTVLDFGCNQGGFLYNLYARNPYRGAYGIDIATESLEVAEQRCLKLPVKFGLQDDLEIKETINIAFSHEVLYLLPDLKQHAKDIDSWLAPEGIYYAAIGCHTENPLWPRWKSLIQRYSNIEVMDYSLDDYAAPFFDMGYEVSAKQFTYKDFVPLKQHNDYFPRISDSLNYHYKTKTLFKFKKK